MNTDLKDVESIDVTLSEIISNFDKHHIQMRIINTGCLSAKLPDAENSLMDVMSVCSTGSKSEKFPRTTFATVTEVTNETAVNDIEQRKDSKPIEKSEPRVKTPKHKVTSGKKSDLDNHEVVEEGNSDLQSNDFSNPSPAPESHDKSTRTFCSQCHSLKMTNIDSLSNISDEEAHVHASHSVPTCCPEVNKSILGVDVRVIPMCSIPLKKNFRNEILANANNNSLNDPNQTNSTTSNARCDIVLDNRLADDCQPGYVNSDDNPHGISATNQNELGSNASEEGGSKSEGPALPLACCVVNQGLVTLVVVLVIITVSAMSALIYFVAGVNGAGIQNSSLGINGSEGSNFGSSINENIQVPVTSKEDIPVNQTTHCGHFPSRYLPKGASRSLSATFVINHPSPTESNATIRDRILGGEPANIRQYPWQNESKSHNSPGSNILNRLAKRAISYRNRMPTARVMGAYDVLPGRIPWQVSLWRHLPNEPPLLKCGGSIILKDWLVTAAHCVNDKSGASSWTVYAGMSVLSRRNRPPAQTRLITLIIIHQDYDSESYDYDIALMKLDHKLEFSDVIQPICIPPQGFDFPAGTPCYVSGWGAMRDLATKYEDVLRQAKISIIAQETCSRDDWYSTLITDRMICAGKSQGGVDACQGDSGGPLSCYSDDTYAYMLAGSVSWGIGCGLPKYPGIYSRMSLFTDWIWTHIGKTDGLIPDDS